MDLFLGCAAGVLLVGLVIFVVIAARRGMTIQELSGVIADQRTRLRAAEEQIEEKSRSAEEAHGKLSQLKSEAKKAKKKAFMLEQRERDSKPEEEPELDRLQEQALQDARSEARRSGEEAARAAEECARLRGQVEKLKEELREAQQKSSSREEDQANKTKQQSEKVKQLEAENRDLKKKLESARRKAKTDGQVYMVTKSKLDLAMQKITELEKALKSRAAQ